MAKEDATAQGIARAFADWLEMHPVTVADVMEDAIKKAAKEWLDRNGPDLFGKKED
jgi:hypothetical protein